MVTVMALVTGLPWWAVRLPSELAAPLRTGDPSVVGYVDQGRLVLDLIAVDPRDDSVVVDAVRQAARTCT